LANSRDDLRRKGGRARGDCDTYCVAAINGAGLEGPKSAAAQAKTLADTDRPSAVGGCGRPRRTSKVRFSGTRRADRRGNDGNYALDNEPAVIAAALSADGRCAAADVTPLAGRQDLLADGTNIKDRAKQPNAIAAGTAAKSCTRRSHRPLEAGRRQRRTGGRILARRRTRDWSTSMPKKAWVAGKGRRRAEFGRLRTATSNSPTHPRCRRSRRAASRSPRGSEPANTPPARATRATVHTRSSRRRASTKASSTTTKASSSLHWLTGDWARALRAPDVPAGAVLHVAAGVDKAKAKRRIYVNGKLDGSGTFNRKLGAPRSATSRGHSARPTTTRAKACLAGESVIDTCALQPGAERKRRVQTWGGDSLHQKHTKNTKRQGLGYWLNLVVRQITAWCVPSHAISGERTSFYAGPEAIAHAVIAHHQVKPVAQGPVFVFFVCFVGVRNHLPKVWDLFFASARL